MASKEDHERQDAHNQDVTLFLQTESEYGDWTIILKFYTALQLLRAHIAAAGQGLRNDFGYPKIKRFILDDTSLVDDVVMLAFDNFLELSKTYRYHCQWPDVQAIDRTNADAWLQIIRDYAT